MNTAAASNLLSDMIASLDLADFEDVQEGVLTILHPKTKAPTGNTVQLAGMEHPARKRIDMARTRKMRTEFAATGKMPVTDPVEEYEEQTDYLVSATLGWSLIFNGEALVFTADNARQIYTDPKRQWFRQQVMAGLQKTELFIGSSAKA